MNVGTTAKRPQHLQALERANEVRLARAELKRGVAEGRLGAGEVIRSCPPEVEGMPVAELLMSQRRWGATKCRRVLGSVLISELRPVGALTERQRDALAQHLEAPGADPQRSSREAMLVGA